MADDKSNDEQLEDLRSRIDTSHEQTLPSVEISTPRGTTSQSWMNDPGKPVPSVGDPHNHQFERRGPRYTSGHYSSYEEMLAAMEDNNDPFLGQPPPPGPPHSDQLPDRWRSMPNETQEPKPITSREKSMLYDQELKKRKRKKKRQQREEKQESLEGTYTLDNKKQKPHHRRDSCKSTGTYVLDNDEKKLLDNDATRPSCVDMSMGSPPRMGDTMGLTQTSRSVGKMMTVDVRQQSHSTRSPMDESAIRFYVRKNLQHRECKQYMRDERKEDASCQCGRELDWHNEHNVAVKHTTANKKQKWKADVHTRTVRPTCYGTIDFNGFGQEAAKDAPYVRVDADSDLDTVWTLLSDYWQMPVPKLIISVTGGAKRFFMKPRLTASFNRGLINAATSTGAWIVTGGTKAGVMEFVGEAVKDYMLTQGMSEQKVVALGIATWGIVDNKEALVGDDENGCFPAVYSVDDLSDKSVRGISPLDPNHTHFILVDNGTEKKFGAEIQLRTNLEQHISSHVATGVAKNQSVHVPVVCLVLEGGENTLQTAAQSILSNTPVVVIDGSGRAADFIALGMRSSKSKIEGSEEVTSYPEGFDKDMEERAHRMFDWEREKDEKVKKEKIDKCVQNLKHILDRRNMVTVFGLDDQDNVDEIDQAILYALLKANRSNAQSQLNLALAWNRCDVARKEIFTIENRHHWQQMDLQEAMLTALVQDRSDFVQLFLDNGVDLKRFLTVRRLRDLYDDVVNDPYAGASADLLKNLLQQVQYHTGALCCRKEVWEEDMPNLLRVVGRVIALLLPDHQSGFYKEDKFIVLEEDKKSQTGKSNAGFDGLNGCHTSRSMRQRRSKRLGCEADCDFDNPERELFIWAVLLNRMQLARMFWKAGRDHIGSALMGSALLKSLSEEADKEEEIDLSLTLLNNANEFEKHGVEVLTECYQRDKKLAHQCLTRELTHWGGTTLFSISDAAEQMEFMGHTSCQTLINKIWKGRMALYTSNWKIMLGMIVPFILPIIKFTPAERESAPSSTSTDSMEMKTTDNKIMPGADDDVDFAQVENPKKKLKRQLYTVNCCACGDNDAVSFFEAVYLFHHAPAVKFMYHTLSYLIYLGLFSVFVLTDLRPADEENSPSYIEMVIWGWAFTLLLEEGRQIATKDSKSLSNKLSNYFASIWNRFDQFVYLMFLVSIICRFLLSGDSFVWARMAYCITLGMYYIRFMQTFFISKNIGPKVIMIRRMLTDLLFFISILLVFMAAYGVSSQALRYPNTELSWNLLKEVLYKPYWQMYGELFLEELEGDVPSCTNNRTLASQTSEPPLCPQQNALVIVLFIAYMLICNILLLNLLIAMFSYTFEQVQDNSEKVWRYNMYNLVYEYFDRPTLAPPLIIISHAWRAAVYIRRRCRNQDTRTDTDFLQRLGREQNSKLTAFERNGMERYLIRTNLEEKEHIGAKVNSASDRIEKVIVDLEQIKEQVGGDGGGSAGGDQADQADTAVQLPMQHQLPTPRYQDDDLDEVRLRLASVEQQLDDQHDAMQHVISLLQHIAANNRPSGPPAPGMVDGGPALGESINSSYSLGGGGRPPRRQNSLFAAPGRGQQPNIEIQDFRPANSDA